MRKKMKSRGPVSCDNWSAARAELEEADAVRNLIANVMLSSPTWINREGIESPMTLDDIIIIAPYNTQVFELQTRLPGARWARLTSFKAKKRR